MWVHNFIYIYLLTQVCERICVCVCSIRVNIQLNSGTSGPECVNKRVDRVLGDILIKYNFSS
jgi:hypothetical protein